MVLGPATKYLGKALTSAIIGKAMSALTKKGKNPSLRGAKPTKSVKQMRLYRQITSGRSHLFKQKLVQFASITTSVTGFLIFGRRYRLNLLANYTEYTSLFDQYRIRKIKHVITSQASESSEPAGSTNPASPFVGMVVDADDYDTTGWVDFSELSQYRDWSPKKLTGNMKLKRYFTPAIQDQINNSDATQLKIDYAPLLDCASPDINHYGLKVGVYGQPSTTYLFYETITFYLEFQNKR